MTTILNQTSEGIDQAYQSQSYKFVEEINGTRMNWS